MHQIVRLWLVLAVAAALPAMVPLAAAGDHRRTDHEVARQALLRGEIMPLEAVLAEVRKSQPGEFVGVELELKHGLWVYGIKLLTPDQRLTRIKVDARTGKILPARKEQEK